MAGALLLAALAAISEVRAQDTNALVLTNGLVQTEEASTTDAPQTGDAVRDEDASGTNITVSDTNQMASPGPDGRTRRRIRRSQSLSRNNPQTNTDSRISSPGTNSSGGALDYSAFRLVVNRNIFDPNRVPHSGPSTTQPKTVDAFTLVGTMSYEKGIFAFFDGTRSDYQKVLKPEDTIAGYKVLAISADSVKLMMSTNNVVELSVGTQMRRREDGSWERQAKSETYAASSASNSSSEAAPSGAESDVIKKMMLRREKE